MSKTVEFTLTNSGEAPVEVESIGLSAGTVFSIALNDTPPFEIAVGSSVMFDVTAASSVPESASAELTIIHSGANSPYTVSLEAEFQQAFLRPDDIAGLTAWYDISQETGLTNGQQITQLTDFSFYDIVNPNNIGPGGSGNPTYVTNSVNGLPVAQLNPGSFGTQPLFRPLQTIILIGKLRNATFPTDPGGVIVSSNEFGGASRPYFLGTASGTNWVKFTNFTYYRDAVEMDPWASAPQSVHCYELLYDASIASEKIAISGPFGQTCPFDLCEICAYDAPLSGTQRTLLFAYHQAKWGIT